MSGDERREKIIELIRNSNKPVSGSAIAKTLGVSRQVIVQDIALIRAQNIDINSTYQGYVIEEPKGNCSRVFHVRHNDEDTEKELNLIIDAGGKVLDVFIIHPVYGRIEAPINVYSRNDVSGFMQKMRNGEASPLKNVTGGEHYHTVLGYSEQVLNLVEQALEDNDFLI